MGASCATAKRIATHDAVRDAVDERAKAGGLHSPKEVSGLFGDRPLRTLRLPASEPSARGGGWTWCCAYDPASAGCWTASRPGLSPDHGSALCCRQHCRRPRSGGGRRSSQTRKVRCGGSGIPPQSRLELAAERGHGRADLPSQCRKTRAAPARPVRQVRRTGNALVSVKAGRKERWSGEGAALPSCLGAG